MASPTLPLSGRVAVITGASSGIGAATALRLARDGASVALLARSKERLDSLASTITQGGGRALALGTDVLDAKSVKEAAKAIAGELGVADLVLNNAGYMRPTPMEAHPTEDWERMIDLNVKATVRVVETFVEPLLAAAKAGGRSDLINVSSVVAQTVAPNFNVYAATKAAVTHLSRHLRAELGPRFVRVMALEPGLVDTALHDGNTDPGARAWLDSARKSLTWMSPEEVAGIIAFATALPRHINFQQLTLMPTQQA
ncbi:SDR family oxidoreductase [Corallococcus sp. AB045]|uniref:SDR family oxidoreductase n=1 Tax=Corallococcus sp. AB045 TaxID=2316719 RepID=UPI000EEFCFF5|nr:SDR family oxidoreductase [Corallococcus sp. AB045]RKH77823.1 SDR family oxidoreductase [Corallococcus sp. AB045]